jgi:RimJ/RimL family protein N-acetyltransferase
VDWPTAEPIQTPRLTLEPLRVDHAAEMVEVLGDPRLYEFTGGRPPPLDELGAQYAFQVAGHSPDRRHGWLNWIVRERAGGAAVGTVQATLTAADARLEAEIAWVIGTAYQRRGYAKEAAGAIVGWLRGHGAAAVIAHIHPNHVASMGVARHLGLTPTSVIEGGETRWTSPTE